MSLFSLIRELFTLIFEVLLAGFCARRGRKSSKPDWDSESESDIDKPFRVIRKKDIPEVKILEGSDSDETYDQERQSDRSEKESLVLASPLVSSYGSDVSESGSICGSTTDVEDDLQHGFDTHSEGAFSLYPDSQKLPLDGRSNLTSKSTADTSNLMEFSSSASKSTHYMSLSNTSVSVFDDGMCPHADENSVGNLSQELLRKRPTGSKSTIHSRISSNSRVRSKEAPATGGDKSSGCDQQTLPTFIVDRFWSTPAGKRRKTFCNGSAPPIIQYKHSHPVYANDFMGRAVNISPIVSNQFLPRACGRVELQKGIPNIADECAHKSQQNAVDCVHLDDPYGMGTFNCQLEEDPFDDCPSESIDMVAYAGLNGTPKKVISKRSPPTAYSRIGLSRGSRMSRTPIQKSFEKIPVSCIPIQKSVKQTLPTKAYRNDCWDDDKVLPRGVLDFDDEPDLLSTMEIESPKAQRKTTKMMMADDHMIPLRSTSPTKMMMGEDHMTPLRPTSATKMMMGDDHMTPLRSRVVAGTPKLCSSIGSNLSSPIKNFTRPMKHPDYNPECKPKSLRTPEPGYHRSSPVEGYSRHQNADPKAHGNLDSAQHTQSAKAGHLVKAPRREGSDTDRKDRAKRNTSDNPKHRDTTTMKKNRRKRRPRMLTPSDAYQVIPATPHQFMALELERLTAQQRRLSNAKRNRLEKDEKWDDLYEAERQRVILKIARIAFLFRSNSIRRRMHDKLVGTPSVETVETFRKVTV